MATTFKKAINPSSYIVHKQSLANQLWTLVAKLLGHLTWAADDGAGHCRSDELLREVLLTHCEDGLSQGKSLSLYTFSGLE